MTWNEFVNYVQSEIDKVTNIDPDIDFIDVSHPDNSHPVKSLVIALDKNGELTISQ